MLLRRFKMQKFSYPGEVETSLPLEPHPLKTVLAAVSISFYKQKKSLCICLPESVITRNQYNTYYLDNLLCCAILL